MSSENKESREPDSKPKIIVDSDWKEQVAKEKQAAAAPPASEPAGPESSAGSGDPAASDRVTESVETAAPQTTPPADAEPADAGPSDLGSTDVQRDQAVPSPDEQAQSQPLPEPTFEILVSMLFTQAISSLGQMPNPIDGKTEINKPMAKHSIDMLDMLTTKTKGNLSDDEAGMLREALHALRMAYVSVRG